MRSITTILTLAAIACTNLEAQAVTGALVGRVLTTDGRPLPDVVVTASIASRTAVRSTSSDARGYFHMPALPAASYTILVRQVGYRPIEFRDVVVQLGRTTTLGDVKLDENAVDLPEIVVIGDRPLIDPTTTTAGGNLTSDAFQTLPVDRNFRSLVSLFASANASFLGDETNIGGATGQENAYYIDGVNVTDPRKARTSTSLPYNFIREIQVKTGGYEAEYGRALGGIVNVVTESGTNDFRGRAFSFYTGSGLASDVRRGLLDADIQASSGYDVGLSISGPVARDRLWFFASYDLDRLTQSVPAVGFGNQTDLRTAHLFAGKVTWRPDTRTDASFIVLGDPTTRDAVGPAEFASVLGSPAALANVHPFLGRIEEGGVTLAAQARRFVGRAVLLEAAVSRQSRADRTLGQEGQARTEPVTIDFATGSWSGGFGVAHKDRSLRTAAKVSVSLDLGRHVVKGGGELEDNRLDWAFRATDPGIIFHLPSDSFLALYIAQVGRVSNRVASLFIQDSWLLTGAFRVNAGVRWDGQYITGADGRRGQSITNQFAPRLGVIWQMPTASRQTISASFARFYEQLPTSFATTWMPFRNGFYFYAQDPLINPVPYDTADVSRGIPPSVPGLRGQYLDEWSAGYERLVGSRLRLGLRGVRRSLREVIDDGNPNPAGGTFSVGNPGRGSLDFLPRLKRKYTALEFTLERRGNRGSNLLVCYVLSGSRGNYTGLYASDVAVDSPNNNRNPDFPQQVPNSTGFLPNDRRHVFKLSGSWVITRRFSAGSIIMWASGTPLSELGAIQAWPAQHIFLSPRGSVGRTPSLFDLSVRASYESASTQSTSLRIVLDFFHILSARKAVTFDQIHYLTADAAGNQSAPNVNYLKASRYQPPMSVRLGLEASF